MASQKFCGGRWLLRGRSGGWILGDLIPRKIRSVFRGSRCGCPSRGTFRSDVVVYVVVVRGFWVLRPWWKAERRRGRGAQLQSLLPLKAQSGISTILALPLSLCEMPLKFKSKVNCGTVEREEKDNMGVIMLPLLFS